jgi:hypothetical protein
MLTLNAAAAGSQPRFRGNAGPGWIVANRPDRG